MKTMGRRLVLCAAVAVIYAPPMAAQERWGSGTVDSREDLSAAGDLWIETRTITTGDGRELTVDVGRLVVPENRSVAGTDPIQVAFARIRGPADAAGAPLVYLAGGPGDASTWMLERDWALGQWLPLLADRDVILLDQRGSGESSPRLRWRWSSLPSFDAFASKPAMDELAIQMATRARTELEAAGRDLAGYTTVESARDIDALRAALGIERLALLGFSYGTHLGIAYARMFPDRVEAMVLAGVEGPDQTLKLPLHMDTQFRRLSRMVAADPELGPDIPDMVALLRRVQERLEREPMAVVLRNPVDGETFEVPVGRHFLDFILRRDIGDASDLPVFPRLLWSIDHGDPTILQWFTQKRAGFMLGIDGMSAVMDVASGASPARRERIRAETAESLFRDVADYPMPLWDDAWAVPDLGDAFRAPFVSDVRALLISGTLDFNTPPFQAEQLRWGMTDATHLVVENAGHEQTLPHPEIRSAILRFLRGEDVGGVRAAWPPLAFVPLEGYDPERTHPSVPEPGEGVGTPQGAPGG